jgi:pimeloyl-ACP methyl ester carboxylesterase
VYLPFEGDASLSIILSKAFLLSNDGAIKDQEAEELKDVQLLSDDRNDLDNLIPLCTGCHTRFDKPRTRAEYEELFRVKRGLIERERQRALMREYPIEDGIHQIVAALGNVSFDGAEDEDCSSNPFNGGNITFQVDNGATLAPFDPSFLLTAPAPSSTSNPGITTLVVPSTQMILQGSKFYAFALVTAGVPSTTSVLSSIQVSVLDGNLKPIILPQNLLAFPVPVVLIHGLWGAKNSLASTQSYLQQNTPLTISSSASYFLSPICYSPYLAYYAKDDSLRGHGTGCEMTSSEALTNYLSGLYNFLDDNKIVGGRVDVVAHSMGGLVVRNYSTLNDSYVLTNGARYKNNRNRNQGTFRDIITLDTPETGSPLAYYLDDILATKVEDPSQRPSPSQPLGTAANRLWEIACGFNPNITVQSCLQDSLKMPLGYPGLDLTKGAVYSLIPDSYLPIISTFIPGGPQFSKLPDPNIPNATWFAIAGSYLDNGQTPKAAMRDFLNDFLAATYPVGSTPLTLLSMLGNPDNDVIVTRDSQLYHAIPGQSAVFPNVAHSTFPLYANSMSFFQDNRASITDSPAVNQQIATWLGYQSIAPLAQRSATTMQAKIVGPSTTSEPENSTRFSIDGRLAAKIPDHSVELAQAIDIPVTFSANDVVSITAEQSEAMHSLTNQSDGMSVGSGTAKIVRDDGLIKTIEVMPLQIGIVNLTITAVFADGGTSTQNYRLNVAPSSKGLKSFSINHGSRSLAIVLEDKDEDRQWWLEPEVIYRQLDYPVYLTNSDQIRFSVEQSESDPLIRLDPHGMVHGLRPGKARIIADFDGMQDSVVVTVYAKESAPVGYRRIH